MGTGLYLDYCTSLGKILEAVQRLYILQFPETLPNRGEDIN